MSYSNYNIINEHNEFVTAIADGNLISINHLYFANVIEHVRNNGKYSSRPTTMNIKGRKIDAKRLIWDGMVDQSIPTSKHFVYTWHYSNFGLNWRLEKWDNATLNVDDYRLVGREWDATCVWDRSYNNTGAQDRQIQAMSCYGRIKDLKITNYEAYQHDIALYTLFSGIIEE